MNTQAKPQVVSTLNIASDTIEHMWRAARPAVADNLHDRFAVVQRPADRQSKDADPEGHEAVVELVTVSNDNQLLHVRRDEKTDSGWRADKIKMPGARSDGQTIRGNIQKIAAFYQGKSIYAMVHYPGPTSDTHIIVAMVYKTGQGWSEMRLTNDVANALNSTRQTDVYRTPNGYHFFYGVSTAYQQPQFVVVFETGTDGVWAAVNETVENEGATYRLLPGSSDDKYGHTLLEITADGMHSREFFLGEDRSGPYIEWSEELAQANISAGQLSASNVHTFPSRIGTRSLLLHTEDNQLHYVAGYTEDDLRHQSLTGGDNQPAALESICIGRDRFDRATVFATSARDRRLWVLRQTGLDANNDLTFADWVCLGNVASVIGCPRAMLDGAELFLVNPNNRHLVHLRQNEETTIWHRTHIKVAVKDNIAAEKTTVHAVDIRAEDANRVPVANCALELQSDVATDVTINGVTRQLTSETWIKVNADIGGKLSLTMPADSLTAPDIQVRVSATGEVFNANPDARVAQRLRGKDPRIKLDVLSMRKAGLIPDGVQGEAANNVVSLIREIGKANETCDKGGARGGQAKRFTVDANQAGTQAVQRKEVAASELRVGGDFAQSMPQTKPQQMQARRAADPLAQLVGDFINWLENAWEDVKKFVVTVGENIVRIVFTIGDAVKELVVNTAEGIARAFESVFQGLAEMFRKAGEAIAEVVTKIVKFVQALFGWEDILVCNDMLQLAINDTLDSAADFFSTSVVGWVQSQVSELKKSVDQVFDHLESSLGGVDPKAEQARLGRDEMAGPMQSSMEENRVSTDLVQNQMQREPDGMQAATQRATQNPDDPLKQFLNMVEASYKANIERDMANALKTFNPTSIEELFSQGLATAVKALRPMIQFAIDVGGELLMMGIRLVGKVLQAIKSILNTPLNIPIVSDFYKEHSGGRELKIMDIATLLVAAPMTIIYKLTLGGKDLQAPFSKAQVDGLKKAGFSWGDVLNNMNVITTAGRTGMAQQQSVGADSVLPPFSTTVSNEMMSIIEFQAKLDEFRQQVEDFLKPLVKPFTIAAGFYDFAYGIIAGFKQGADTTDITGTAGSIFTWIGRIGSVIRFALTVPALALMVVEGLANKPEPEEAEPFRLPLMLSIGTALFAILGLGLTIFKAPMPAVKIIDTIAGFVIVVLAVITMAQLAVLQKDKQDIAVTTREGMGQLSSLFASIPGLFAWMTLAAAAAEPVSRTAMLITLVALEVVFASLAGFSTIMSVALPGLFEAGR